MSIIVQKYGGTSVGSIDKIRDVAKRVIEAYDEGHQSQVINRIGALEFHPGNIAHTLEDITRHEQPKCVGSLEKEGEARGVSPFGHLARLEPLNQRKVRDHRSCQWYDDTASAPP